MTDKNVQVPAEIYEQLEWLSTAQGVPIPEVLGKIVPSVYRLIRKVRDKDYRAPEKARPLNIYLVSQYENTWPDTYQSFMVAAYTEDEARRTHPHTESTDWPTTYETGSETWVDVEDIDLVVVQRIGTADSSQGAGGAGTVYCYKYNEDR